MVIKQFFVCIFVFIICLKTCFGQKRIVNGTRVWNHGKDYPQPRYMAYLVKSEQSVQWYRGWSCGGAIISPQHILTAAACVTDVDHLYAIVGYDTYIDGDSLYDDPCTRKRKKRVVKTCAPKSYNVHETGWTTHDIAVAMLESPLDFNDASYKIDCSYPPAPIKVNFNPQFEKVNTDVVTMGWGHSKRWKMPHHLQDYNLKYLQESTLIVVDRDGCRKKINTDPEIELFLDIDIICAQGGGNVNRQSVVPRDGPLLHDCDGNENAHVNEPIKTTKEPQTEKPKPNDKDDQPNANKTITNTNDNKPNGNGTRTYLENAKRSAAKPFEDHYDDDTAYDDLFRRSGNCDGFRFYTRRNGLCQNDHGVPLVAWVGTNPVVIGVASTNLYDKDYNCVAPNLFTSTTHNEWFIKCAVKNDPSLLRLCLELELRDGITTNEEISNWIGSQVEPNLNIPNTFGSYQQHDIQALQNIPHSINTQPFSFNHQQNLPNEPQNIPPQSSSPLQPQYIPVPQNIPKIPIPPQNDPKVNILRQNIQDSSNIQISQNIPPQSNLPIQPELISSLNNIPKIPNQLQNEPNMNILRQNVQNIPNIQISQNPPPQSNLPLQRQYIPSLQNVPEIPIQPQNDPNMNIPRQNIQDSPNILLSKNIPPQSSLPLQPQYIPLPQNIPKIPIPLQNDPNVNILRQNIQDSSNIQISQNIPPQSNLPILQELIPSQNNIPKIPNQLQNEPNMNILRQNIPNIKISQNPPPQSNLPLQQQHIPSRQNVPETPIRPQNDPNMNIPRQNIKDSTNILVSQNIPPQSNLPIQPEVIPSKNNIPKIPIRPQYDLNINIPRQNKQNSPNIPVSQIRPHSNLPLQTQYIPLRQNIRIIPIRPSYDPNMKILRQNVQHNSNIIISRPVVAIQHQNRPTTPVKNQNIPMEKQQAPNQRRQIPRIRLRAQDNLRQVYRSEMLTELTTIATKTLLSRATVGLRKRNQVIPERVQWHKIAWNRRNEKQASGSNESTSTVTSDRSNKTESKL